MADAWYLSHDGKQSFGPYTTEQMKEFAGEGRLQANSKVWRDGMPDWVDARTLPDLFGGRTPPPPMPGAYHGQSAALQEANSKKILAGILGIMLGMFGVHKFVLGFTGAGIAMAAITLCTFFIASPVIYIIGLIEGIIYLTKSDEEFYQTYIVGKKAWF
jgi:TM2 domain-containing membrane protein YozV